jgi:hypothetical protein
MQGNARCPGSEPHPTRTIADGFFRARRLKEPQTLKTQEKRRTIETHSMSVPNAASKTLSRKYSPPNQSGKIANATSIAASIQPESFFAEFIF